MFSSTAGLTRPCFMISVLLLCLACSVATTASAQQAAVPSNQYYAMFYPFYEGDYTDALDGFESALRSGVKVGTTRWIDSICYYTMIGECYFQMGRYDEALGNYNNAMQLYLAYPDWLSHLQFTAPVTIAARRGTPWGASTRNAKLGNYPKNVGYEYTKVQLFSQNGGQRQAIDQREVRQIQPAEIVRCMLLSMRRRIELLGPLCQYDSLSSDLLSALQQRPGVPNHWSQCWTDALLGMGQLGAGKPEDAKNQLSRAVLAANQFDHEMTGSVLLELGKLALRDGDFDKAMKYFTEASIVSYYYFDGLIIEESLRWGCITHLAAGKKGIFEPLVPAITWSKLKKYRSIQVPLLGVLAENQIAMRQTPQAVGLLNEATAAMMRRDMAAGRVIGPLEYVRAMAAYQAQDLAEGDSALAAAFQAMQRDSLWLFQLRQLEMLFTTGKIASQGRITTKSGMDLYDTLLREPNAYDWAVQPLETLSVLKTPHVPAFGHWFLLACERNSNERSFEIADRCRRHRFFNTLSFGGRLLSLRHILEAPEEDLDKQTLLDRQELLNRYPAYAEQSRRARQLRSELQKLPPVPTDEEQAKRMSQGLQLWQTTSLTMESMLREMAVRRENAPLSFPPLYNDELMRPLLPEGSAMLCFFSVGNEMYAYLLSNTQYDVWRMRSSVRINQLTAELLRSMGHFDPNRPLDAKDVVGTEWKQQSKLLLDAILDGSQADFSTAFPELIVVPDGMLWYVPFEALHVEIDGKLKPLISQCAIRYAPTAGLAFPNRTGLPMSTDAVVEAGPMFPRDEPEVAQAAYLAMSARIPRLLALYGVSAPGPTTVYAAIMKQLIVLSDIYPPQQGPYSWSPIQIGRGKPGNQLSDWLTLPWGGPQLVILPGFHTAAENGLKQGIPQQPGSDLFLSACALMADDANTVLISRWRTGGQSSIDLVTEFLHYLHEGDTAAVAWRKAIYIVAAKPLTPDKEPRLRLVGNEDAPQGNHPFFWAGMMLIDRGQLPAPEVDVEDEGGDLPQLPQLMPPDAGGGLDIDIERDAVPETGADTDATEVAPEGEAAAADTPDVMEEDESDEP